MKTITTYNIAMAAGQDAGNRNAAKHGRAVWAAEDWDVAAETARKLFDADAAENFLPAWLEMTAL